MLHALGKCSIKKIKGKLSRPTKRGRAIVEDSEGAKASLNLESREY